MSTAREGVAQGYPQGQPVLGNGNNLIVPSALTLDAHQFPGADMCAQINAAYMSILFTGNIDASAFSGDQACNSNPFHGKNATVHLYLNPGVRIVTSVPWFTPQMTHSIEGLVAGNISQDGGAIIEACGPSSFGFMSGACPVGGVSVPQFPGAISLASIVSSGGARLATCNGTCPPVVIGQVVTITGSALMADNGYQTLLTVPSSTTFTFAGAPAGPGGSLALVSLSLSFRIPHGPFPVGTYACVLCIGAEGDQGGRPLAEGNGWNGDADAFLLRNIKVELGGNSYIFGVYAPTSQERSELEQTRGSPSCSLNCAAVFYDRTEAPIGASLSLAGVTRPIMRDFNLAGSMPTGGCTNCYGVVFEGGNTVIQLTNPPGTCLDTPTAFVTSVSTFTTGVTSVGIGDNGKSGCSLTTPPGCTIAGAPQIYGGSLNSGTSCTANVLNGQVASIGIGGSNTGFSGSSVTGGPLFEDINVAPSGTGNKFHDGIWIEGAVNAEIAKAHCLNLDMECVLVGSNSYTAGGVFRNIDGNGTTAGPLHLGYSIDNSQFISSFASGAMNLLVDDKNSLTLTVAAHGSSLGQYNPLAFNALTQPIVIEIANDGGTGTTLNKLAKLTTASPSTAVLTGTTDSAGAVGIVVDGAGTVGNARIAVAGQASCIFDNTPVPGDYVQIGSTAGDCHDFSSSYPPSGQVLGRVLSTTGSSGPANMLLFGSSAQVVGPAGSNTQVQFNNSGAFGGAGGLTYVASNPTGEVTATQQSSGDTTLNVSGGTVTSSRPFLNLTGTWAASSTVVDAGILENVTSTSSGTGSLLMDLQVASGSKFNVDKVGNVTATGFAKTAQSLAVTGADFTCGSSPACTSALTITGLSVALPLATTTWSFTCDLVVSQATAPATDKIYVQTATNQAASLTAEGFVAGIATGAVTDVTPSTTTAQVIVSFIPTAMGVKMPVHLGGTIEGASASGTTLNIMISTGSGTDVLTVYRGSSCLVY